MHSHKTLLRLLLNGIAAYCYSIIVQTPFAIWYWKLTNDQYIAWALAGFPITMIFFGEAFRTYLNYCNKQFDKYIIHKLWP